MIPATFIYALKSIPTALRLSEDYMRATFKAELAVFSQILLLFSICCSTYRPKNEFKPKIFSGGMVAAFLRTSNHFLVPPNTYGGLEWG